MQQAPSMLPAMPSFPPTNITTDQIEKCLEENKKLILAILDNQNLGKLAECAQYQAQLQKNLMYLAAIADAQPQMSMMPAQMSAPHPAMQQGAYYMHPQAAAMAQQNPGLFPPKMHMQFASPHQPQQEQHLQHLQQQHQHQQAMQGQMNILLGGGSGMHSEAPGQNKQDAPRSSAGGYDGGGNPSN